MGQAVADYRVLSPQGRMPNTDEKDGVPPLSRSRNEASAEYAPLQPHRPWLQDYSTFARSNDCRYRISAQPSLWQRLSQHLRLFHKNHSPLPNILQGRWKFSCMLVLCLATSYYRWRDHNEQSKAPEWKWDHNVYNPWYYGTANTSQVETNLLYSEEPWDPSSRNLLLAQVAGNPTLESLTRITSRPNRAYARQWVRDYVRYAGSSKRLDRVCFDKVALLRMILHQQQGHTSTNNRTESNAGSTPPIRRVPYDAIVLLPPDAIIADLDYDLLSLFPSNKLLAITGYDHATPTSIQQDTPLSEVIFFNLRHKYAASVVELWHSLAAAPATCGAGNDVQLLLDATRSCVENEEEFQYIVVSLEESSAGFVGDRAIKIIPQPVPSSKAVMLVSNVAETRAELHTTADSVCYRYYPRCDVL